MGGNATNQDRTLFHLFLLSFFSLKPLPLSLISVLSHSFNAGEGRPAADVGAAVFSGQTSPKPKLFNTNPPF
jgi:hypothetical protein